VSSVSVIIPTYNRAALLDRCLRSLRASGLTDLEVIVVDDGGADDSAAVTYRHGGSYIRQTNAGPAAARNRGFEASKGDFIAFIDSDDEWINGGVTRLRDDLDANSQVGVAFADTSMGNDADGFVSFIEAYGTRAFYDLPHRTGARSTRILERRPFLLQLATRNVMFLGSLLFRRTAFAALRGFDPALRGAADWDIFMRAVAETEVAFSPGPPLSKYFKHDEGMSTDRDHMTEEFIRALESVRARVQLDAIEGRHVETRIRDLVFGWALRAYRSGATPVARNRLRLGRQLRVNGFREALLYGATWLPRPIAQAIRRVRQTVSAD
jgi:glycosyltransferase involved in cell wall biosynthesis